MITSEATNWLPKEAVNEVIDIISKIPKTYLSIQEDCNRKDVFYCSDDVLQIRPSTHAIFYLKKMGLVVKILYDREKVENEKRARAVLNTEFMVVPMLDICYNDGYLILMPYIDGAQMLDEVSKYNLIHFVDIYDEVSKKIYDYIIRNRRPLSKTGRVIYAGRSLECMQRWTAELIDLLGEYRLFSYNTGMEYNLSELMKGVLDKLNENTQSVCLFSGDVNCHNILYAREKVFFIDFEYWGDFDVEYLVSILLGSLFTHCDLYKDCFAEVGESIVKVGYALKIDLSKIESLRILKEMCLDNKRIKAFIFARMYYKFIGMIENKIEITHIIAVCAILDYFSELQIL